MFFFVMATNYFGCENCPRYDSGGLGLVEKAINEAFAREISGPTIDEVARTEVIPPERMAKLNETLRGSCYDSHAGPFGGHGIVPRDDNVYLDFLISLAQFETSSRNLDLIVK